MSTRAVYTFKDQRERNEFRGTEFSIYKHHDGYPSGALKAITNALSFAWTLPRYEASDFAAAFVAGNKPPQRTSESGHVMQGGGVYLTRKWQDHGDLKYRYEIECKDGKLNIKAYKVSSQNCVGIFEGDLEQFQTYIKENEVY